MTDPRIPHLLVITLAGSPVNNTQVVAINSTNGDRQVKNVYDYIVIFDVADFTNAYANGDIILFENVGASHGSATITVNSAIGLQEATITAVAAPTNQISL